MKQKICNPTCRNFMQIRKSYITSECKLGTFKKYSKDKLQEYHKGTQYGEFCDKYEAR